MFRYRVSLILCLYEAGARHCESVGLRYDCATHHSCNANFQLVHVSFLSVVVIEVIWHIDDFKKFLNCQGFHTCFQD